MPTTFCPGTGDSSMVIHWVTLYDVFYDVVQLYVAVWMAVAARLLFHFHDSGRCFHVSLVLHDVASTFFAVPFADAVLDHLLSFLPHLLHFCSLDKLV